MEKIIIFSDHDDGYSTILKVVKVKNWDNSFSAVVGEAKRRWQDSDDELFATILTMLAESGYEVEEVEYNELFV